MRLEERYKNNKRSRFQQAQTKQFLKLLDKQYDQVLEVGCGKGYWSYVGCKHKLFKNCYGSDIYDDWQIKELRKYCQQAEYKKINDEILPYETNRFDLVFSMDVVEHIKDDVWFIKEHLRVCKKGGEIIIGTPNYWRITNILLMLIGKLKYPRNMGPDSYGDCIHLREYKMKELVKKTAEASDGKLASEAIKVYPCWIGILMLSWGIEKFPAIFNNFCHFFFIKFTKN